MGSNNRNEAITNLAMPERQIPVLIDSSPEKAEGFVPSTAWSDKPVTSVRRLLPSFVDGLRNPRKRREIEKEHGTIHATEWNRLRELLALIDRVNAGDWSPIVTTDLKEALEHLPAQFDGLSFGGWFPDDETGYRKMKLISDSGDVRGSLSIPKVIGIEHSEQIEPGKTSVAAVTDGAWVRKTAPPVLSDSERTRKTLEWNCKFNFEGKSPASAIAEAFTAGLSKTRFVVWWSDVAKKLVPGLYCPDIVTALYALAMWSSGTAGGWAICQKCHEDYPRSRAKQRYCSHKCQVAAAMQRLRDRAKSTATAEAKLEPKAKRNAGRK
ncbi:MAG: hypothetical protein ABSB60_09085 [Terracidiphilus sp.]|jgi:hypothetical protein